MDPRDKELIKKIETGMTTVRDAEKAMAIILQRDNLLREVSRLVYHPGEKEGK